MNKLLLIFIAFVTFSLSDAFGQHPEGTKGMAKKQARIAVRNLPQQQKVKVKIKVPNPGWQAPDWSYDQTKVIFRDSIRTPLDQERIFRESSPLPDTTFIGLLDNGTSIPPDVNGAAGPDHLMQTLNTEVRISDKSGNELFTTSLSNFWDPMPNNGATFDPKIVYDPYTGRWIMITPSGGNSTTTRIYVAVSTGSNPLDEWNMYWIDPDTTNQLWFDYPNLGFNKNWISIGGIMRNSSFEAVDFVVFAFDKQAMIDGEEEAVYSRFTTNIGSAIVPSFTYDENQDELYLISTGDGNDNGYGYINLFEISGSTENPVFTVKGSIGIPEPWENWSYENHGDFLPQMGSPEKLNSVDARMHTMISRNNKLWAVHHIYLPADDPQRCSIQWWELDTSGVILDRGRIDDTTNTYSFAFPSIAVNANEDMFIGHGVFSEEQYAGAAYSFKAYFDDPGTVRSYYQYKEGLAPYYKTYGGGRNRWGDYSAVFVDPVYDVNFWAMHEYAEAPSGSDQWGTWWAFLRPTFPPQADFSADEVLIPTGESVDFTDLTLGVPDTWSWTFEKGEPDSSSAQNPAGIVYNQEGSFDVTLITSNDLGTDTVTKENYITVSSSLLPEVNFSADKHVVCTLETVQFTDLTQYLPIEWEWQFDPSTVTFVNGTDNSSQNPEVVFEEATTYSVTLTAWNLNGSSTLTQYDMVVSGGYTPYFKETFEPENFRPDEWKIENPDDDMTWDYFQTGGTAPGEISAGIDFKHYYAVGERDRLISPPLNLENMSTAVLEFQYAYAKRIPELTDSLIVLVSADCGETWTRVFAGGEDGSGNFATHELTDDFWPETSDDWCLSGYGASCISVDLSAWAGISNVNIAFESWSGYGNPLFIDNVQLSLYVGTDNPDDNSNEIRVFPNPVTDVIHVILPETSSFTEVKLVNQLGRVLVSENINNNRQLTLQTAGRLSGGLYYLLFKGEGKTDSRKIVIR